MTEKGTERAARVADLMQTLARLIVLVIIIPAAILLAIFFLLEGLIPDSIIRGMFSLTFGLGLAGGFVARMKHPLLGSAIVTMAAISGAVSLAIFWNSAFASAVLVHVFSIILLGISNYLYRVNIIPPWRWTRIKSLNGSLIVLSAPLAIAIYFISLGFLLTHTIAISLITLWIYSVCVQYYTRNLRLGLVNATIPAGAIAMIVVQNFIDTLAAPNTILLFSIGLLSFGIGLLATTQITRFFQRSLSLRPVQIEREKLLRAQLLREVGLDNYAEEALESVEPKPEWLINTTHAQSLSGLSILLIAIGIPYWFIWMSAQTLWGLESAFYILFNPLAFLISLVILIPSPVLFHSGGTITQTSQTNIAKALGLLIVVNAALISIIWTQHFLWGIWQSSFLASCLFITGITGVSERIRRIWRNLGQIAIAGFRRARLWVSMHVLHTGIAIDLMISIIIFYIAYPIFSIMPNSMISLPSMSIMIFSLIELIGAGLYSSYARRNLLASVSWSMFLCSSSLLSFWFLSSVLLLDFLSAVSYSVIWFIGFAALQKLAISRQYVGIPFLVGVLGFAYHILSAEMTMASSTFPLLSVSSIVVLLGLVLYREYSIFLTASARMIVIAGRRLHDLAARGIRVMIDAISRFAYKTKRVLMRIGGFLYRGAVFIVVQLVRFVLVLYVAFLLVFIGQIGFNVLYVSGIYDTLFIIFGMGLMFFIALSPALAFRERHKSPLLRIVLLGICITLGGFVFSLSPMLHLGIRIPLAFSSSLILFSLGKNWLPERAQTAIPLAAWISLLTAGTVYSFLYFLEVSFLFAFSTALFVLGAGLLPLKVSEELSKASDILYLILCVPFGTLLMYLISYNILYSTFTLLLLPIIILHKQYATAVRIVASGLSRGLRFIASGLAYIGRFVLMVLAVHVVITIGLVSMLLSFLLIQWILPLLQLVPYVEVFVPLLFSFSVLLLMTPLLYTRRLDYQKALSGSLISLAILLGSMLFILFTPGGLLRALLVSISITFMISAICVPNIEMIERRVVPVVISMTAFLFLCLDLLSLDLLMNIGIASFCLSFLSVPFLSKANRIRIVLPISSTSFLGLVFYYVVLPVTDVWLTLALFVALDAFLLSAAPETRSWQMWWIFAISAGYVSYFALAFLPLARIVIAILVGIELIRMTPDIEYRFSDYHELLDISRALLISSSLWLLVTPYVLVELALELCIVTFLIISAASLWSTASSGLRTGLADMIGVVLAFLTMTNLHVVLRLDFMFTFYMAMLPVLVALVYGSKFGTRQKGHGLLLRVLFTVLVSISWYSFYRSTESIILSLSTGILSTAAIAVWAPWTDLNKNRVLISLNAALILFFESVWIWHSVLLFGLPASMVFIGSSVILMMTLLFPLSGSITWLQFEAVWDFVSLTIAISFGSLLAGWDLFLFTLPPNPVLALGWGLTCFSLVSVPMTFHGERKQELQTGDRISHMTWLPAIPGISLLGFAYSALVGVSFMIQLGVSIFCLAFASTVFAVMHPNPSRTLKYAVNMLFSMNMSFLSWILFGWTDLFWGITISIGIWYLFSLPVLMEPTYVILMRAYTSAVLVITRIYRRVVFGLTRIYRILISGLARAYAVIKANSENIALGFPVMIGFWFGMIFLLDDTCSDLLGLGIRNCFQGMAVGAISIGVLYFLESFTLNGNVSKRVKGPSVALIGRGMFILLLAIYLPEVITSLDLIAYFLLGSLALSFFAMFFLNLIYGFKDAWRRSLTLAGFFLVPSVSLGLVIFEGILPITAIVIGAMLGLLVEAPIIESQIRAFLGILRALGAKLARMAVALGRAIKAFFVRLGYINWIVFSAAFSIGVSWISYPFFSELLGMTSGSVFYVIPNIGIPILLLGMLLLSVATIRRTVNTSFGTACTVMSFIGAGLTGTSWLFDHGLMIESVAVGVALFCLSALAVLRENQLLQRWVSLLWTPIPISLASLLFVFLHPYGAPIESVPMAASISAMMALLLLLLSTYSRLLPDSTKTFLWIATSVVSAFTTFTVGTAASFPLLATVYLSVFVMSWIMYPVTRSQYRHLFFAPLFFSLTGFAFTFVFGEYYQGLLLALSSFLLFIVLFIKDRETKNPRLAYLRLVMLLVLLGSLVIFGMSMIGAFTPAI